MALHCSCKLIKTLRSDIIKSGTCSSNVSHVFDLVLATMKAQAHRLRYSSSCSNAVHQRRSITSQLHSNPNARMLSIHSSTPRSCLTWRKLRSEDRLFISASLRSSSIGCIVCRIVNFQSSGTTPCLQYL